MDTKKRNTMVFRIIGIIVCLLSIVSFIEPVMWPIYLVIIFSLGVIIFILGSHN